MRGVVGVASNVRLEYNRHELLQGGRINEDGLMSCGHCSFLVEIEQGLGLVDPHSDHFLPAWVRLVIVKTREVCHHTIPIHGLLLREHSLPVSLILLVTSLDEAQAAESFAIVSYTRRSNCHHAVEGGFRDEAHQGVKICRVQTF